MVTSCAYIVKIHIVASFNCFIDLIYKHFYLMFKGGVSCFAYSQTNNAMEQRICFIHWFLSARFIGKFEIEIDKNLLNFIF